MVCDGLGYLRLAVRFVHLSRDVFKYHRRDVFHAFDEIHKKTRIGLFFLLIFRPKTVGEVIVFHRRVRLNGVVPAVVIGQNQALVGYHLPGAKPTEVNHTIFKAGLVGVVQIACGEPQTAFFQLRFARLQ